MTADAVAFPGSALPEPPVERVGPRVVIERELLRVSRRWQTFAQRAGFAAVLLVVVAFFWETRVVSAMEWDPSSLAYAGQRLFEGYAFVQGWMLVLLTPILVSQGILEERNAGTLQLLAITRLSPQQLLLGKLASRLLIIEAVIFAGLPVLAPCLSLGGVEPYQVANTFLQANAMVLSLAAISAFVALYATNPIVPAVAAWIWMVPFWMLGGGPMAAVRGDEDDLAWISPIWAQFEGEGLAIFGPIVVSLVLLTFVVGLAGRVSSTLAGGDKAGELLSAEVWSVERFARRLGMTVAALAVSIAPLVVLWAFANRSNFVPEVVAGPPIWAWTVSAYVAASLVYLFGVRKGLSWVGERRTRRLGWRRELERLEEPVEAIASRSLSLSQHARGEGRRIVEHRPMHLRPVWGNPVAWREVVTSIHGGFSRWIARGYMVILAGLLFLSLFDEVVQDEEFWSIGAFFSLFVAWGAVALGAASSVAGELRSKTLELLAATQMSPRRIVAGKLAGITALAAPPLLTAITLLILGVGQFSTAWRWGWDESVIEPAILVHRWAGMSAYALTSTAFLATTCLWLALRSKTPGRAWMSPLLWVVGFVLVPSMLRLLFHNVHLVEDVLGLMNPAFSERFWQQERLSNWIWVSSAGMAAAAFAVFLGTARSLGKRAARG